MNEKKNNKRKKEGRKKKRKEKKREERREGGKGKLPLLIQKHHLTSLGIIVPGQSTDLLSSPEYGNSQGLIPYSFGEAGSQIIHKSVYKPRR